MTVAAGAVLAVAVDAQYGSEWNAWTDDIGTMLPSDFKGANGLIPAAALGIDTTDATAGAFTLDDSLTGSMGLVKLGPNTLILSGTDVNTYTGGTTVSAGTLQAPNTSVLPNLAKVVVLPGAVLAVNVGGAGEWNSGATDDIGTLVTQAHFHAGSALGIDTTDLTGTGSLTFTYSGAISGSLGLTKLGTHTLLLNGVNTYTGGTMVSGGTLSITNSSALGSGGLSMGRKASSISMPRTRLPSLSGSAGGVLTDLSTTATGTTTVTVSRASSGSSNYGGAISDGGSRTLSLMASGWGRSRSPAPTPTPGARRSAAARSISPVPRPCRRWAL